MYMIMQSEVPLGLVRAAMQSEIYGPAFQQTDKVTEGALHATRRA